MMRSKKWEEEEEEGALEMLQKRKARGVIGG